MLPGRCFRKSLCTLAKRWRYVLRFGLLLVVIFYLTQVSNVMFFFVSALRARAAGPGSRRQGGGSGRQGKYFTFN